MSGEGLGERLRNRGLGYRDHMDLIDEAATALTTAEARIQELEAALRECESIAKQAEIFATGRRPSLDPTERWIMIQDTARRTLRGE